MPSKTVTDRQKSTRSVSAAIKTHTSAIHDQFAVMVAPVLENGEQAPDLNHLFDVLGRVLIRRADDMVAADEAHIEELGDDDPIRQERNALAEALYAFIVELRQILTGLYGPRLSTLLNLSGNTPVDPVALERFAGELANSLRKTTLPAPRLITATIDAAATALSLDEKRKALKVSLDKVAIEVREAEATQATKNTAIGDNDRTFLQSARSLEALARLVGLNELADRVRPSSQRPGLTEEDVTDTTRDVN